MHTRASLLCRIRDPRDARAWDEFVRIYAPLLLGYGRRRGLQEADAADIAQDTLRNVVRAAPGFVYDQARGSFRGWLFTLARNQIRKFATRFDGRGAGGSDVRRVLEAEPDPAADRDDWDREYRLALFHRAADRVRPDFRGPTWDAFWRTAVDGEDPAAVAAALGLSTGAVYVARSRVTSRIRQEVRALDGDEP
ncbi:MAG TPA: sigma-70 family RNA polymerase sigma factor [Gemmataceae bacterium]|jgi:RNA polymerase sigma factor (sigma-70 family)|nr:sigma-70 family RNA polymerase sigma factor [Gemmataceae bacterium]